MTDAREEARGESPHENLGHVRGDHEHERGEHHHGGALRPERVRLAVVVELGGSYVEHPDPRHCERRDDNQGEGLRDDARDRDEEQDEGVVVSKIVGVAPEAVQGVADGLGAAQLPDVNLRGGGREPLGTFLRFIGRVVAHQHEPG